MAEFEGGRIKRLTAKGFAPFGWIIECPDRDIRERKESVFSIVLSEKESRGWRIAYLVLRERTITMLERHADSYESFEPVRGRSLIYVARKKDRDAIRVFALDRPVILDKGVWHGVVTLDKESEMKITENADVRVAYWQCGLLR